jgi:hypothetical protein
MGQENKLQGVVNAVGLERDEQEYQNFTLVVGIKVKTDKKITYSEGERLMKQLQKDLMGKNIEFEAVAVQCPVCGKTFNSDQGVKQHQRLQHQDEEPNKSGREKKAEPKKKKPAKKKTRKPASKKK